MQRKAFLLVAGLLAAASAAAETLAPIDGASFASNTATLRWQSEPEATYRVVSRTSLTDEAGDWNLAGGYVSATGWTAEEAVASTNRTMFFRVEKVDQSGPSFSFLAPSADTLSVATNAAVRIAVEDESGVAEEGLAVYVGGVRHALGEDARVSWDGAVLSYAGGALGAPGETVELWATATDVLGNTAASASSLVTLASDPVTVGGAEIVVAGFGTASVVSTGTGSGTSIASTGPNAVWIEEVGENTILFGYTGEVPLAAGQLWASDDPNEIFYRRILSWEEAGEGLLLAQTEEATLADFFDGGSFSSEDDGWSEWEWDEATSTRRCVRTRIAGSTAKSFETNGTIPSFDFPTNVPLAFAGDLGEWEVGAGFSVAADFALLKRKFRSCDLCLTGGVHVVLHPEIVSTEAAAYSNEWSWTLAEGKKTFGGTIGPVPVWVDVAVSVPATLTVQAEATNARVAARIDISRGLDFRWKLSNDVWKQVGSGNTGWVVAETNFEYAVEGSAGVRVALKPTVAVKVYSLIGAEGWVEPYLEAEASGYAYGKNRTVFAPDFHYRVAAYAGLNAGVGLLSTIWSDSWGDPPSKTFSPIRKQLFCLEGSDTPPAFVSVPEDRAAESGETVMLSATAEGTWPLHYAWYHDGADTGRRENFITLRAGDATAGRYTVEVSNAYGSETASATVAVSTNVPLAGLWRFRYQWEDGPACCYAARIYASGAMRDTSPGDYWWDWHLNGDVVRFETRERWEGTAAVYRGTRKEDGYLSGTMTSPAGKEGTWSMTRLGDDPDAGVSSPRIASAADDDTTIPDPAGW